MAAGARAHLLRPVLPEDRLSAVRQRRIATGRAWAHLIDILNKDCRRSCSAILTWVLEYVKISARPLNSVGN